MNRPLARFAAAIALATASAAVAPAIGAPAAPAVEPAGGVPAASSDKETTPKQTQGATFGEKVNAGLQAAGSGAAVPTPGAPRPDDVDVNPAAVPMDTASAATDAAAGGGAPAGPVGARLGGASGGAAAASYAATGRVIAPPGDADGGPARSTDGKQKRRKAAARHDTAKNAIGNVR